MAIVFTELTGGLSTTDATAITSASINVTVNVPLILFLGNAKGTTVDVPTVSDSDGNTWSLVRAKTWNSTAASLKRGAAYSCIPAHTTALTVVADCGANSQTAWGHSIINCAGADPTGTVVASAQMSNANADTSSTDAVGLVTMAAFGDAVNNGLLYACWINVNNTVTKQASQTLIRQNAVASPNLSQLVSYQIGENLAPDCSWTSSNVKYAIGLEIKALGATATKGVIVQQPSSTALSGIAFTTQPTVQLQDVSSQNVAQAGVDVVATIATGTGTLGGTTTVATDANGLATFTNLKITGSGSHTITFTPTALTAATSNAIVVALNVDGGVTTNDSTGLRNHHRRRAAQG